MLEVKNAKSPLIVIVLLGIFFVSMGLMLSVSAFSSDSAIVPLIIGLLCFGFYAAVLLLFIKGYRKSVRHFTGDGLTRNDGRKLAWTKLDRVVNRTAHNPRTNRLVLRRCEIHFNNGEEAWILPPKVANFQEVIEYADKLPCEHLEK